MVSHDGNDIISAGSPAVVIVVSCLSAYAPSVANQVIVSRLTDTKVMVTAGVGIVITNPKDDLAKALKK